MKLSSVVLLLAYSLAGSVNLVVAQQQLPACAVSKFSTSSYSYMHI